MAVIGLKHSAGHHVNIHRCAGLRLPDRRLLAGNAHGRLTALALAAFPDAGVVRPCTGHLLGGLREHDVYNLHIGAYGWRIGGGGMAD